MRTKICTKCRQEKKSNQFYKQNRYKNDLSAWCKKCIIENSLKWRRNNIERFKKNCKLWSKNNPERCKINYKKWCLKNPNKVKEINKRYRKKCINKRKKYSKDYFKINKTKCYEMMKVWRKNNPEKIRAIRRKSIYKRRLRQKFTNITTLFLIELKAKTKICPYCYQHIKKYHLDHIIPLSKGGTHTKDNVCYCCAECNLKKNNKMIYNCSFSTYRRGLTGSTRAYSGDKTITNGAGFITPADDRLRGILGADYSVDVYVLLTEETNIQETDKVVISSTNYYVEGVSDFAEGSTLLRRAILRKKKS